MTEIGNNVKENVLAQDFSNLQFKKLHKKIKKIKKKWKKIDAVASNTNDNKTLHTIEESDREINSDKRKKSKTVLNENAQGNKESIPKVSQSTTGENGMVQYKKKKLKTPPPHEIKEGEVKEFLSVEKAMKIKEEKDTDKETVSSVKFIYHKKGNKRKKGKPLLKENCADKSDPVMKQSTEKKKEGKVSTSERSIGNRRDESFVQTTAPPPTAVNTERKSGKGAPINDSTDRDLVIQDFLKYVSHAQTNKDKAKLPEEAKKYYTIHNFESKEILNVENKIADMNTFHLNNSKLDKFIDQWYDRGMKEKKSEKIKRKNKSLQTISKERSKSKRRYTEGQPPLEDDTFYSSEPFTSTPKRLVTESEALENKKRKAALEREEFFKKNKSIHDYNNRAKKRKLKHANIGTSHDLSVDKKGSGVNYRCNVTKEVRIKESVPEKSVSFVKKKNGKLGHADNVLSVSPLKRTIDVNTSFERQKSNLDSKISNINKLKPVKKREAALNNIIGQLKDQYGMKKLTKLLKNLKNSSETIAETEDKNESQNKVESVVLDDSPKKKKKKNKAKAKKSEKVTLSDEESRMEKAESEEEEVATVILSSDVDERNATDENIVKAVKRKRKVKSPRKNVENVPEKSNKDATGNIVIDLNETSESSVNFNQNQAIYNPENVYCIPHNLWVSDRLADNVNTNANFIDADCHIHTINSTVNINSIVIISNDKISTNEDINSISLNNTRSIVSKISEVNEVSANNGSNLHSNFSETAMQNDGFLNTTYNLPTVPYENTTEEGQSQRLDNWDQQRLKNEKCNNSEYSRVEETTRIKQSPISIKGDFDSDLEFSPVAFRFDADSESRLFESEYAQDLDNYEFPSSTEDEVVDVIEEIVFEDGNKVRRDMVLSPDLFASQE